VAAAAAAAAAASLARAQFYINLTGGLIVLAAAAKPASLCGANGGCDGELASDGSSLCWRRHLFTPDGLCALACASAADPLDRAAQMRVAFTGAKQRQNSLAATKGGPRLPWPRKCHHSATAGDLLATPTGSERQAAARSRLLAGWLAGCSPHAGDERRGEVR